MKDNFSQNRMISASSLFFLTAGSLALEVCLTRLFSVLFLHAYAYLIISLSMAGLGFGAVLVYFLGENRKRRYFDLLAFLPLATFGALLLFNAWRAHITLIFLPTLFLFAYIGSATTHLFQTSRFSMPRLYAIDLCGAAAGALASYFLLNWLGGVNAIVLLLVVVTISLALLNLTSFPNTSGLMKIKLAVALVAVLFLLFDLNTLAVPRYDRFKNMSTVLADKDKHARIVETRWTAFGRSDLVETDNPLMKTLYIDGAAGTKMVRMKNGELEPSLKKALKYQYVAGICLLPIPPKQRKNALVIGSGGGIDVVTLLASDYQNITAVEINPDFISIVKEYGDYNGGIYNGHPAVNLVNQEGRSFIRKAAKRYDLISMSLPIIKSARNIGSYALTENHLFTYEAFSEYWHALDDNGYLIVVAHYPTEAYRLAANIVKAFDAKGVEPVEAMKHMVLVGRDSAPLLILRKKQFTAKDGETYYGMIRAMGLEGEVNFVPYVDQQRIEFVNRDTGNRISKNFNNELLFALSRGQISLDEYIARHGENISWISDDSPFFYQMKSVLPWEILFVFMAAGMISVIFTVVFLREKTHNSEQNRGFFACFAVIGFAFIQIEIAAIQKFILFWGHKTLALSFLLALILISMGLGSLLSGYIKSDRRKLMAPLFMIPILVLSFHWMSGPILKNFETFPALAKAMVTGGLTCPVFFMMGFPFPVFLGRARKCLGTEIFPWLIGINSITTLLGGVAAILTAILFGYRYVLMTGALCYAFLLLTVMFRARWLSDVSQVESVSNRFFNDPSADSPGKTVLLSNNGFVLGHLGEVENGGIQK